MAVRMREYEVLHDEFDVYHAAAVVLEVEQTAPVRMAMQELPAHGQHIRAQPGGIALHLKHGAPLGFERGAHGCVARAKSRPRQQSRL